MIPRTYLSTFASNGQQQMRVYFLSSVTGLQRWADYIPVKLTQGGTENSYANDGYIDVEVVGRSATDIPFKDYVPVYADSSASDAWQVNATGYIPYGYAGFGDASLVLDFTSPAALDPRITFTRASTATRFNASGVLTSEAINAPRFDYDPVTLAPKGLLIEESQTNLVTYSEQFDNAAWTKTRSSITANAIVSPDGTMDADKLVEDTTASNTHLLTQGISFTSGTAYTCSIFAKQAEAGRFLQVTLPAAAFGTTLRGAFDLTNGTFALTASTTCSITPVGNGWYKCSITGTATATISATLGVFIANSSAVSAAAVTYTGDGTSGIYIWGAQLEAGAFATSYIPTVASQVTRAADLALMTGTNFSSWYNATEGTLFAEFAWEGLRSVEGQRILVLDDGTTTTYWGMLATGGNGMQNPVVIAGTTDATNSTPSTTYTASTPYKQAVALALNNSVGAINGIAGTTDTAVGVPSGLTTARFAASSAAVVSNLWFRRIAYYNRRLTNAELQGITS